MERCSYCHREVDQDKGYAKNVTATHIKKDTHTEIVCDEAMCHLCIHKIFL